MELIESCSGSEVWVVKVDDVSGVVFDDMHESSYYEVTLMLVGGGEVRDTFRAFEAAFKTYSAIKERLRNHQSGR